VVIIGLSRRELEWPEKRLFSYDDINGDPVESRHRALSPYLFDASGLRDRHIVVEETAKPIANSPKMIFGNMPNDGGELILSSETKRNVLEDEPEISDLIRPLLGAHDFLNGEKRYCLWLVGTSPKRIRESDFISDRVSAVRKYRSASTRNSTRRLAETPSLFGEIRYTGGPFVLVPRHSSENREYLPMGFFGGHEIAHDSCLFCPNASLFEFGILTSAAHMAWLRYVGGRLKSDYRYSAGLVLNTFPWPEVSEAQKEKIRALAQAVLDARARYPEATLADLYDPDTMPADLRKAHHKLDAAVDALYKRGGFAGDRERVEHLFGLYEKLVAPLEAASGKTPRRAKRKARPRQEA